ncbi:MAG: hypothetical protein EXS16_18490 [Gemmataceae bacterium]|nr:hypothetical protein [Gemmataceae bacterium]
MQEIVTCPECRRRLQVPPEVMGQRVQCSRCQATFLAAYMPPPIETGPAILVGAVTADLPEPNPIDIVSLSIDESAPVPASASQRKRFQSIPVPNQTNPAKRTLIIGAVIVAVAVTVTCVATSFSPLDLGRHRADVMRVPLEADVPRMPSPRLDAAAQQAAAKALLDHLGNGIRNNQPMSEFARNFDGWRTIDDLVMQSIAPAPLRQERTLYRELAFAFAQYFKGNDAFWQDVIVARVNQLDNGDLCAISRHRFHDGVGGSLRFRWWMTFHENQWRIYDGEEIDFGNRVSLGFPLLINRLDPNLAANIRTMHAALLAMRPQNNNFVEADKHLDQVRPAELPQRLQAKFHLVRANAKNRLGDHQLASDQCDEALRKNPDALGADYYKAISCTWLNRNDLVLEHAKKHHDALGDDHCSCYIMGIALFRLGRRHEAAAFYRKSLDDNPKDFLPFLELLVCLNANEPNGDLGKRFLALQNPAEKFVEFAEKLWQARNGAALTDLTDAMRKLDPQHVDAEFYQALAAMNQGKENVAFRSFANAWKRVSPQERRDYFTREFSQAAANGDAALRAYRELPSQADPFRYLARELWRDFRMEDLRELVDEHAKKKAKDTYLRLYQAELFLQDEDFSAAKTAYAAAATKLNNVAEFNDFRYNRVRTLYRLGEAMQAYAEIGPRDHTFRDLAQQCWSDKNFDTLTKLVEAHEKNNAGDPQLLRWSWRIALNRKQFDRLGPMVKQAYEVNRDRFVLQDFANDMVQVGEALEGYKRMPNPSVDVEFIATALALNQKPQELRALIALHRKKFPEDRLLGGLEGEAARLEGDWKAAAAAFAKAWPLLPDDKKVRWRFHCLQSHHKIGKTVEAYRDLGMQHADFRQLATMLLYEKNIDGFEKLVDAHRPQRANDNEFDAYEARLKIFRNKTDEAIPLLAQAWKQIGDPLRRQALHSFVNDLLVNGKSEEAYRCAPDRVMAFQQICWQLRQTKKIEAFETLVKLHAVTHFKDIQLVIEQAELALLKNDPAQAETLFAEVRARPDVVNAFTARINWLRARIAGGKVVPTYRELGASQRIFLELANDCAIAKNGAQLEVLLRAHRQAFPHATKYDAWDIEVLWLKKDYKGTIREIRAKRKTMLKGNHRWKMEGWLVRSCVLAKKSADAIAEAETITKVPAGAKNLMVLALASTGDVKKTIAYVELNSSNRYFVDTLYRDEDLGPILRGDAFRTFRDRYPEPPANFNEFRFDDDDDDLRQP